VQIIAILIGLVLLAAIVYYVSRPLIRQRGGVDVTTIASLELQRDALYSQIRELDMDHATGKTNDEDYQIIRAELVAQAAEVLKRIDGVAAAPAPTLASAPQSPAPRPAEDVEALIAARRKAPVTPPPAPQPAVDDLEAAIAARRKLPAAGPVAAKPADDEVEALIAARRKQAASAPVCPNCGKPVAADDAFCAKCGASLRARTVSQA